MEHGQAGGCSFPADGVCMGPGQYFLLGIGQISDFVYQRFSEHGFYLYSRVDMPDHHLPQGGRTDQRTAYAER